MSESRPGSGPGEISRFRAVVLATLRVKQLRRGSKPRIELDHKKHKDTTIAMAEVRKGVISFTQSGVLHVHEPNGTGALQGGVEESLPAVGSTGVFRSL